MTTPLPTTEGDVDTTRVRRGLFLDKETPVRPLRPVICDTGTHVVVPRGLRFRHYPSLLVTLPVNTPGGSFLQRLFATSWTLTVVPLLCLPYYEVS